jgi:peroxiredoxin
MRARAAVLGVVLAAAGSACAGDRPATPPATAPAVTDALLPRVEIRTLAGEPAELGQVARGRVTLVSFWATWCEACAAEMDALNRLARKTADNPDALVVGVAVGESPSSVEAFARRRGLAYTQLVDDQFLLADALGQRKVPATLVIDRAGRVVHRGDALDGASLEAFRKALDDAPRQLAN